VKLFSGRTEDLKTMNRILTDSARQRAQRVDELERALDRQIVRNTEASQRIELLERELAAARERIAELEARNHELTDAATQRAARIAEVEAHNLRLNEAATQRAARAQQLERELEAARAEHAAKDFPRLESDRAFYRARLAELEAHNRDLTAAATQRAARVQELERELEAARIAFAEKDFPRLEAENAFYTRRVSELEAHNRELTEAATGYALRVQELERELTETATRYALRVQELEQKLEQALPVKPARLAGGKRATLSRRHSESGADP